jgi:hypothetical protein
MVKERWIINFRRIFRKTHSSTVLQELERTDEIMLT